MKKLLWLSLFFFVAVGCAERSDKRTYNPNAAKSKEASSEKKCGPDPKVADSSHLFADGQAYLTVKAGEPCPEGTIEIANTQNALPPVAPTPVGAEPPPATTPVGGTPAPVPVPGYPAGYPGGPLPYPVPVGGCGPIMIPLPIGGCGGGCGPVAVPVPLPVGGCGGCGPVVVPVPVGGCGGCGPIVIPVPIGRRCGGCGVGGNLPPPCPL